MKVMLDHEPEDEQRLNVFEPGDIVKFFPALSKAPRHGVVRGVGPDGALHIAEPASNRAPPWMFWHMSPASAVLVFPKLENEGNQEYPGP